MNRDNFHPIMQEPPIAHALDTFNTETNTLSYEYNGRSIITIHFNNSIRPGYRMTSDVCMQSAPMIQQIFVETEDVEIAHVTFRLSKEAVNMRPHRAESEQAILGQTGHPLLHGVNGLYDIEQDLLITWHGAEWTWADAMLKPTPDGDLTASLRVELSTKPWLINLYPQYYRTHLGYRYYKPWEHRPNIKPIAGWCSWEAFRRNVNMEALEQCCELFRKTLQDYGLAYMQVDDGYEKTPVPYYADKPLYASWLDTDPEKFPGGHQQIASFIKKEGFKAGIWTHSSVMNEDFVESFKECFLQDNQGKTLEGDWAKYILNCKEDMLREQVLPIYQGLKKNGYQYVKVDALRHLLYDGLLEAVRQGVLTNEEAEDRFRNYLLAIREGLGDDIFFLACWGTITQAAGIADACRIAQDSNPNWPGVRMQMVESARWFHTHGILFLNDPDHICARTHVAWLKSLASLVSLSGQLYMLSDPMDAYDETRLHIISRTLPPAPIMTAETGPVDFSYPAYTWTKLHGFFVVNKENPTGVEEISKQEALDMAGNYATMHNAHPFSTLWAFHFHSDTETWCVAARIATAPLATSTIQMQDLSLNPEKKYIAFDFWKQEILGVIEKAIDVPALELGECQLIGLRPLLDRPQFLASSRHVSMDCVSVVSQTWSQNTLKLALRGIPGTTEDYWVYASNSYSFVSADCEGGHVIVEQKGNALRCKVQFTDDAVVLSATFAC